MTDDLLKEYRLFLEENGIISTIIDNKIYIECKVCDKSISLRCNLDNNFPYEFPEISITEDCKKILPNIPHIYTNGQLCIFDKNKTIPNFMNPKYLLLDSVKGAFKIIEDGITGINEKDFVDEIIDYLSTKANFTADLFCKPKQKFKVIYWCIKNDDKIIIDETSEKLELTSINIDGNKADNIQKGLFLRLELPELYKIPKNDVDIINIIKMNPEVYRLYCEYIQKRYKNHNLIILFITTDNGSLTLGWMHKNIKSLSNGFRKNHINLTLEYSKQKNRGYIIKINDCTQERLFLRGGDGLIDVFNKVAIIGCGSLGGYLTEAIVSLGCKDIVLVDNEVLTCENIARHTLGYCQVGENKSTALKKKISKDNPNIRCKDFCTNAHQFLEENVDLLNTCDAIFVATGNLPLEAHFNNFSLDGLLKCPILYMWVEPYLIGGHVVVHNKKQSLFDEIFDISTFSFKNSIINNTNDYYMRETGCQSTYVPYSGFLLQEFIYRTLNELISNNMINDKNYLITWFSMNRIAEMHKMQINSNYSNAKDHSITIQRID